MRIVSSGRMYRINYNYDSNYVTVNGNDSAYVDAEGHMYGELAESYSELLSEVLYEDAQGTLDESRYFYDSYESMYNSMVQDYEDATGLEWKSY